MLPFVQYKWLRIPFVLIQTKTPKFPIISTIIAFIVILHKYLENLRKVKKNIQGSWDFEASNLAPKSIFYQHYYWERKR